MAKKDIFADVTEYKPYTFGEHSFKVPVLYRRFDCFFAVFGADGNAVRSIMPSDRLKPVPVWPGRVAVMLTAFNYIDTDIGPYGEFGVGVPCTCRHKHKTLYGLYIHRLPVTSDIARVAGVELYGYPKFMSEMEFENTSIAHKVKLTAGDQHVLDLHVHKPRLGFNLPADLSTFTIKDNKIIYTKIAVSATTRISPQGPATVNTGPHEMGKELLGLQLGDRPIAAGDFQDIKMVLPEGESIGMV